MAVEQIKETDTLNQGRIKINAILDQSNASSEKVDSYKNELEKGIKDSKEIAQQAGQEAVSIATEAGKQANATADQALTNSQTAVTTAGQAVSTANNNKQEFDTLRNDFDQLVAESGDSNPEIVQARTDTQGVKRPTLATRLQIDFNDRMTKADGLSLFSGNTNVKIMMDFNGKTAGNTTTNPHKYFSDFTTKTLKKPSDTWNEVSQADYNKLANRDDSGVVTGSTQSGVIPQQMGVFDVVETAKKLAPQIYEGLDRLEAATHIKNNFVALTISVRAKATSPNNKNLKVSTYIQSTNSWTSQIQETAAELTDFTVQINDKNFITDDGYVYQTSYTDASNGVTSSSLDMDYCGIQLDLSVNAQDILQASGFSTTEELEEHTNDTSNPHKTTKQQVGLSNVENYAFANEAEAILGASQVKYMHPKNVANAISAQAVTLSGNQEIDGTKNFGGVLQQKGSPVVTTADVGTVYFVNDGNISNNAPAFDIPLRIVQQTNGQFLTLGTDKKTLTTTTDGYYKVHAQFTPMDETGGSYTQVNVELANNGSINNALPSGRFQGRDGLCVLDVVVKLQANAQIKITKTGSGTGGTLQNISVIVEKVA